MKKIFVIILIVMSCRIIDAKDFRPWPPNQHPPNLNALSLNVGDLMGGFASLSFTHFDNDNSNWAIGMGCFVIDRKFPEIYLSYDLENFRTFNEGLLFSFAKSYIISNPLKESKWETGYLLRFFYRANSTEFDSHLNAVFKIGYQFVPSKHIYIHPYFGAGMDYNIYNFKYGSGSGDYGVVLLASLEIGGIF